MSVRPRSLLLAAPILSLLLAAGTASVARASDCPPDDPSRSDCKAAAQTAENPLVPIAGAVVGAVIAVVVNGVAISLTEVKTPAARLGDKQPLVRHYTLDIQTAGGKTVLKTDATDTIVVSAQVRCDRPEVNTAALTASLSFGADGPNSDWLTLLDGGMSGGRRTATVRAWPPSGEAHVTGGLPRVQCGTVIEGQAVSGAVPITLDETPYETVVEFEPAAGGREYRGIKLTQPAEFAADGEDRLTFGAYVRDPKRPQAALPNAVLTIKLLPENADYELQLDPAAPEPGRVRGWVRAPSVQLHTAERARESVRLKVEAKLTSPLGDEIGLPPLEVPLSPRRLYLKLWVVPGGRSNTSEAGAFVCLAPNAADVLADVAVKLTITDLGGGTLNNTDSETQTTDAGGLARWTLAYSGLTWENLASAQFKAAACIQGKSGPPTQATVCNIHVGQNMRDMTVALEAARETLDLTNHEWDNIDKESWTWWALPKMWRGPAYNVRAYFAGGPTRYTCGELRDRIFEWWVKRRFGQAGQNPTETACMNGVEIGKYFIAPVHVFAGFHLSGADPGDAYMVDPWWNQAWDDRTALTMTTELGKLSSFMFASLPLLAPILVKIGAASSTAAAWVALKNYFLGTAVSKVTSAVIGSTVVYGGYSFRWGVDTGEYIENGVYKDYRQPRRRLEAVKFHWLKEYTELWRQERRAVPYTEALE